MFDTDLHSQPQTCLDSDDPAEARLQAIHDRAVALKLRPEDVELCLRNGYQPEMLPKHLGQRRATLAYIRKNETPPPKWMLASGMFPEVGLDSQERRVRVRVLYKAVILIARRELLRHEIDPMKEERSIFWDPVAEICSAMEISQSKLSSFCKEISGNSLTQVIDNVRVESIKTKMRGEIRAFVQGFQVSGFQVPGSAKKARGATSGTETKEMGHIGQMGQMGGTEKATKWDVWAALKESRKWPEFSQNSWAQGLGFSSYRRLYRACEVVYGMTPHQLEMGLIAECLAEGEESGVSSQEAGVRGQGTGPEFGAVRLEEVERMVREIGRDDYLRAG